MLVMARRGSGARQSPRRAAEARVFRGALSDASATHASCTLNDLQDGWIYDGSVWIERAISQRVGVSVTLSANRQTARDPGYATTSGGITFLGWRDIGWSTLYANAAFRHLDSDARLFLYPNREATTSFAFLPERRSASFRWPD